MLTNYINQPSGLRHIKVDEVNHGPSHLSGVYRDFLKDHGTLGNTTKFEFFKSMGVLTLQELVKKPD